MHTPLPLLKPISFYNLTVDDGLSQNSVISIAQDSIGFLWFATQDGLNRYDGKSFKYYDKHFEDVTKVNYSKLGKIYIDNQNILWIVTNSGKLEKYQPESDDFYTINNIENVSTIFQDKINTYFIGTYNNGIYAITPKKDTIQVLSTLDSRGAIYAFLEHQDTIYASADHQVFKISKHNFGYKKVTYSKDKTINYSSLIKLEDHTIWVGTYGQGLFYFDKNKLKRFNGFIDYPLPNDLNVEATLLDKHQRLWVGTYGKGVYVIDFTNKVINNYTVQNNNPYALHYNDILSLFEDFTGNIWIGTDGAGLSYYDEHLLKFNVLTNNQLPKNINVDVARAICVSSNNKIWIGTSGKGLTCIDLEAKNYKTYMTSNSNLLSNRIMSLKCVDKELWIGYQDMGLDILRSDESILHYNSNSKIKLNSNAVWCIYQDQNKNVWLGTGGSGLICFDKQNGVKENYTYNPYNNASLSSNNIRAITEGNSNELWIGTEDQGLCLLNTDSKTIYRIENIPNKIKSLFFDKKNQILWVGTNGNGLLRFNIKTKKVKSYTSTHGLPNNVIYGILSDNNNNLWLSSNKGITMFNDNDSIPVIINYDKYDGLQTFEFNTGSYFKGHDNTLYFGGLKGINWFKPEQLTLNQIKPKTIITQLLLFNDPIDLTPNKEFNYKQNSLSFSFASLHYSQPNLNNYKYMLVNHDLDWIEAGNNNNANYSNLPPNTYTFKVISSNYDNIWNEEPAQYTFTIKQAWFKTKIALTMYLFLALVFIWYIYKYFKWRWHIKTQLKLEHSETQRLKKLDELKTKLFTNISHEFRTPLSLILGPAENQLANEKLSNESKEDLSLIKHNAKRLLNLVDQLIDLAKLETGYQKLKVEHGNLSMLIHQIVGSFKYQIEQKKIKLTSIIVPIEYAWYDKDVIEKIIINLMANAVKYTPKKGFINFHAIKQEDHLVITILNNGCHVGPKDINQLFIQFYQVNPNAAGVGIGLALVKELVTLTKGQLIANVVNNDELQFTVTIPINKASFNKIDIIEKLNDGTKKEVIDVQHSTNINGKTMDIKPQKFNKPLILVIEDNTQLRQYIKSILKPYYKVILAGNGKVGMEKALNKIPDLIVSDIMMPKTNGIELCNKLKSNTLTSHIPIILLTAKIGEQNELEGLEVGADDFITKPFNSKILVKRIENFINLSKSLQKRYTQFSVLTPKDIAITNLDETFLQAVEEILNAHISKPDFSAQEFSKLMTMSRMQLHRKLMALTGLSTSQFIKSQRLKIAVNLLQESNLNVSEIAYQVGFNSVSYFIKCFKETYNTTPNSYIKN